MPRNGSGTFTPTDGVRTGTDLFVQQRQAGTTVDADLFDAYGSDLASAVSASLAQDGQTSVTADLPMSGFKHTNVDDAAARNQYASAGQVQDGDAVYAAASGSSNAYTATLFPAVTAYTTGMTVWIKANHTNTGAATIALNGLAAKDVKTKSGADPLSGDIVSGEIYSLTYDGTNFQLSHDPIKTVLDKVYPVGAVYLGYVSTTPSSLGFPGTWTAIAAGRMLVGYNAADSDFNAAGKTGGAKEINLEHQHDTGFGWDSTSFYARNNNSSEERPVHGSNVGTGERSIFDKSTVSESAANSTYRTAETDAQLSTSQSVMNPFFTVYMWRRSA